MHRTHPGEIDRGATYINLPIDFVECATQHLQTIRLDRSDDRQSVLLHRRGW
jgi:hypothetical protein